MTNITPTYHDKMEWSRMAQDAYKRGNNFVGHRYSAFSSLSNNAVLRIDIYDTLQLNYREWLINNTL
jgi:hypothetical protein